MATEVKIPTLGESISSGILASWHVSDGDYVEKGDSLFDLETDKITSEGNAEVSGRISLKVSEGDEVEVGQVVAEIDESAKKDKKGEDKDDGEEGGKKKDSKGGAGEKDEKKGDSEGDEDEEEASEGDDNEDDEESKTKKGGDHRLSPAVRRIAQEENIDPSKVEGSGKGGRVLKEDMLRALRDRDEKQEKEEKEKKEKDAAKEKPAASPGASERGGKRQSRRKMTPLRKRIAERLVQAQQNTAMLTTFNEVDMKPVMDMRKKYQDSFTEKHGLKLGFMSFFTKAVVHALKAVPAVNAQIDGEEIVENHYYDIGIAVSTDRGLLVPVVRDCDQLSFASVEKEIAGYAKKARDNKISIDDLQGGVFTITNGGIFGSMLSTPILNQPQSAILGMHTIKERPVVVDGEIVVRPMMYLALSYDHRIIDGREAVTFLVKVKEVIEDPARLLLEI